MQFSTINIYSDSSIFDENSNLKYLCRHFIRLKNNTYNIDKYFLQKCGSVLS